MPKKLVKYDFFGHRKLFFGISLFIIALTVVMIFVNGVTLDIQFKGGSIIKYSFEGVIDEELFGAKAQELTGVPVYIQETADFSGENKQVVLNLAGSSGLTSQEQAELYDGLNAAFPDNKLTVRETYNVDPFYGREFLEKGVLAVGLAALLIVVYVWLRFKTIHGLCAGVSALIALIHDVIVVFAVFVIFKIPLNDAFVAVMLTIIGYSINDTIVIYDRVRENRRLKGDKMPESELMNLSISQNLSRTIITSASTAAAIACVLLVALFANLSSIISFALPMLFGVISGCYSTLFIACPIWVMWNRHKQKKGDAKGEAKGRKAAEAK